MSSELSHGISRLINHPLLLRLLLLHPAGLSSLLALALPPLCPTISCSSRVSWHLPASVSLSWHSQGSFPRQMQRGFHHVVGLGMAEHGAALLRKRWSDPAWCGGCSSMCVTCCSKDTVPASAPGTEVWFPNRLINALSSARS